MAEYAWYALDDKWVNLPLDIIHPQSNKCVLGVKITATGDLRLNGCTEYGVFLLNLFKLLCFLCMGQELSVQQEIFIF